MQAKVFLSCGQFKGSDEPALAEQIANRIRALGFECYFAVADQSLTGLRENIFKQMESSEYFVFVDFRREKISGKGVAKGIRRGSLFSNQELGVASYLELPCLVFQENGVKPLDGMLSCLQANAHPFTDRALLPNVIADMITQKTTNREWSSAWKNAISLHIPQEPFLDAFSVDGHLVRHFHIEVRNNHRRKVAQNCYAVLESITNAGSGAQEPVKTVEFKWAGTLLPSIFIAPNSSRPFDALKVAHQEPEKIYFTAFCDSTAFHPSVPDFGTYLLTYGVYSSNFPAVQHTFRLNHPGNMDGLSLEET